MSESGVVDMFILMGPTFADTVKQYTALTGTAPIPQVILLLNLFISCTCKYTYNTLTRPVLVFCSRLYLC